MKVVSFFILGLLVISCSQQVPDDVLVAMEELPETVDFNFDVRPILSDRCFNCHGPDENTRKAGLRLDFEDEAFKKLTSGNRAFVSRSTRKSEAIHRILSEDHELVMPPIESNLTLTPKEKAIIIKWVEQGAEWKSHWAFEQPKKEKLPKIKESKWPRHNEIDFFIQEKLEHHNYNPSPEAKKERLLRRVTMDLTGLPPTIQEIDAFLEDTGANAYEKVVDRLLDSDAYAERIALDWMDLSRYADSHGLHADGSRVMWPWRDWVIGAFKNNMPYDQFVTWQLAGDLLPNATKEQKLATAFNRNHPMSSEGGIIDEEFRLNYVFDRTETVGTAFMGLTIGCAKCHDHKFDPISQKDYFQLTVFFNNIKEVGMIGDDGNYGPVLPLPSKETEEKLSTLEERIVDKENELKLTQKELRNLETYIDRLPNKSDLKKGQLVYHPFDNIRKRIPSDKKKYHDNIGFTHILKGFIVDNNPKTTVEIANEPMDGIKGKALKFKGEYDYLNLYDLPNFEINDSFSASIWANTSERKVGMTQTLLGTARNKNSFWRGWDFYLDSLNRINLRLVHSLPHNYIHVHSKDSIKTNEWNHLAFVYNGSTKAKGVQLYINGEKIMTEVSYDRLYKSMKTVADGSHKIRKFPVRAGRSYREFTGENGIFKGALDELRIYDRTLSPLDVANIYDNVKNSGLVKTKTQKKPELIREHWIQFDKKLTTKNAELKKLRSEWLNMNLPILEIMVMEEMPTSRKAFIYNRGEYDRPTDSVQADTPEILPDFPEGYPKNRLGLAKWLFDSNNPLTARVTVNRYWQMLFGKGFVNTPQDFGVQGALPTHPQLLDWLSVNFMENDWNVKLLLKQMVMSHTYRQSSIGTEKVHLEDPNNEFLARSNSYRLPAEMIRDNALAASGLLVKKVGGKSVKPYQPKGLWIEKSNFSQVLLNYKESLGDSLYRRGLYTFIRRTAPHPAMTAFDAPSREVCTVRRENTNTPLQALVLLNDKQFVEASRIMAERVQKEAGSTLKDQVIHAFRLATSRKPKKKETELLQELYQSQKRYFESNPKEALALLSIGNKKKDDNLNIYNTAALTVVSNIILNHDDTNIRR